MKLFNAYAVINNLREAMRRVWIGSNDGEDYFDAPLNEIEIIRSVNETLMPYHGKPVDETKIIEVIKSLYPIEIEVNWLEGTSDFFKDGKTLEDLISFDYDVKGHCLFDEERLKWFFDEEQFEQMQEMYEKLERKEHLLTYTYSNYDHSYSAEVHDRLGNRMFHIGRTSTFDELLLKLKDKI